MNLLAFKAISSTALGLLLGLLALELLDTAQLIRHAKY